MQIALLIALAIEVLCTLFTVAMLIIAPQRHEARLWRRLGLASLRRKLTKRLRQPQPLAVGETIRIARRNLLWHIALTTVMASQTGAALLSASLARQALGLMLIMPALAWLAGSLVQRHKLALLAQAEKSIPGSQLDSALN